MSYSINNYKKEQRKSYFNSIKRIENLIPIICLVMFVFLPTSHNSIIYGNYWVIAVWSVVSLIVLLTYIMNKANRIKTLMVVLAFMTYMLIITLATLNSDLGARISLARIAPIVLLIIMHSIKIESRNHFKLMKRLLDIFFIAMILWNFLILINNDFIKELTQNYYSQYYDSALFYSMLRSKPVMSFGVHTYAAYFYTLFFYLSYATGRKTKNNKYYFYCIFTTIFTFFLTSNTSLIYSFVMLFMLLRLIKVKPFIMFLLLMIGSVVLIQSSDYLIERYVYMTQSDISGFTARYTGDKTVFANNIEIIKSHYAVGFNILDNIDLGYSDSGYIVYLTMGNIPFLIGIYYLIYRFIKVNIPKKYFWFIFFVVFSFELALPATFNYRYFFAVIFVVYYLQSLEYIDVIKVKSQHYR